MAETAKDIIAAHRDPDKDGYGEAMQACSPQERAFVLAVMDGKSFAAAAKAASYGTPESSADSFASIGYRVSHRQRVIDAIAEECRKAIRSAAPQAVQAIKEIVVSPFHKDRLKAAGMVLTRIDPEVQKIEGKIEHTHTLDHDAEAMNQLRTLRALGVAREKLVEVFGSFGLERLEAKVATEDRATASVVDAEFTEIAPADPDADLLGE